MSNIRGVLREIPKNRNINGTDLKIRTNMTQQKGNLTEQIDESYETELWDLTHRIGHLNNAIEETNTMNLLLENEIQRLSNIDEEFEYYYLLSQELNEKYHFLKEKISQKFLE